MIALILAAAVAGAAPPAVDAADLTGTWAVLGLLPGNGPTPFQATPVCIFQQAVGRIRGSCKGPNSLGTASGKVEGRTVSWRWDAEPYTSTSGISPATFEGVLGEDRVIRGTMTLRGAKGTFTAKAP